MNPAGISVTEESVMETSDENVQERTAIESPDIRRRSFFRRVAAVLATFGLGAATARTGRAASQETAQKVTGSIVTDDDVPLFSGHVVHGGLVYVAGKGAHFEGDIRAHTDHVLNEVQKELERAGSSMEKVLKVNVYLHDLNDYRAMNETYRGRFGDKPPVRSTVACYGGIPGSSLVEIDCIAAL
jgi:2-iminobutanoate/2-iminopropanoate deaminase